MPLPTPRRLRCSGTESTGRSIRFRGGCLHGLKLTKNHSLGGDCLVQVELSLVLKAEASDQDPGRSVYAAKFYPQIAMKWQSAGKGKPKVKGMRGAIHMVFNNAMQMPSMGTDET